MLITLWKILTAQEYLTNNLDKNLVASGLEPTEQLYVDSKRWFALTEVDKWKKFASLSFTFGILSLLNIFT